MFKNDKVITEICKKIIKLKVCLLILNISDLNVLNLPNNSAINYKLPEEDYVSLYILGQMYR